MDGTRVEYERKGDPFFKAILIGFNHWKRQL